MATPLSWQHLRRGSSRYSLNEPNHARGIAGSSELHTVDTFVIDGHGYAFIYVCIHIYIYMYMYICIYVYMYICIYVYIHMFYIHLLNANKTIDYAGC